MDRGGRLYVDGDQSVGDRVMQLVRQTQALLVEAMDRRRLALSLCLLCPDFNQREAAVQGIAGRQSSEQQRQTSQRRAERKPSLLVITTAAATAGAIAPATSSERRRRP
jgi:hypothetical protein